MSFRTKVIDKIKEDTGIEIPADSELVRNNLSWNARSAGTFLWFFIIPGQNRTIGSCEKMRDLMKSEKILFTHWSSDTELFSK